MPEGATLCLQRKEGYDMVDLFSDQTPVFSLAAYKAYLCSGLCFIAGKQT